ncbi:MAG: class I SAM-dependent methyltransferase [Planctomycetota bacterium]|nr:class I SAM-dependent methyltransferase [Planctomycetota bacterium]
MDQVDRRDYVDRYRARLHQYGYSPETLGWGKHGRQEVRFAVLAEQALLAPESAVLDYGCGFADLYDFLRAHGWRGRYTGVDIVPDLLAIASERHPDLDLRELDVTGDDARLDEFDFVIASGVFNAKLKVGDNREHIARALRALFGMTRTALSVDFLSTHVDFQKPDGWHTDPAWILGQAKSLSRRVLLRHDYMPYEFSVTVFKDETVSERNVFETFERRLVGRD